MNSKKYKVLMILVITSVFISFVIYLKPENLSDNNNPNQTLDKNEPLAIKKRDDVVITTKKLVSEATTLKENQNIESPSFEDKGYKVIGEDDFAEYVELPNGNTTPLFKSYAAGNEEELEADFAFEKRDEEWASNWEHTLNNVVLNAGSTFDIGESKITCKSKICKIGVKLKEGGTSDYNDAYNSLNREFVLNNIKVVPGTMKEEGTGHIIHYFIPER